MAFGLAETAKLAVDLSLRGNFVSALSANRKALTSFDSAVSKSQGRAYRAGQQIGTGFLNAGRIVAAGAATIVGGIVASIKVAGDFEAQLNTINTVALASDASLAKAGRGIRSLAKEYGSTFAPISDLTAAEYDLVSAGIKLEDSQAGLTTSVRLGIGAYGTSAEAVDVLTTAINAYNLKTKDGAVQTGAFTRLSDELAQAVADGKVKLSEIASEYATVAPLAASAGIGTDEIAAALGRVTATGSSAGETLTQMSRAIVEIQKPTKALTDLQDKFHKNYAAIARDKGLNVALQEMRKDADKAKVPFIDLFGRIEAYKFALNTTGPNAAAFASELDRVRKSAGALDKQVSERTQGLNFQLGRTKALFQDALISLANPSLPRVTAIFERLNKAIGDPAGQAAISRIGDSIAGLFSDANIAEGGRILTSVFDSAKAAAPIMRDAALATAGIVKAAISLFRSLPVEIQQLAIGAFAINKLTGGLVTNVGGAIAGGIADFLVKKFAGVMSVNAATVIVTGPGVPGVPGTGPQSLVSQIATALAIVLPPLLLLGPAHDAAQGPGVTPSGIRFGNAPFQLLPKGLFGPEGPAASTAPGTPFNSVTTAINERQEAILGATEDQTRAAELNARRIEAAENRTGVLLTSAGVAQRKATNASTLAFRAATAALRNASGANAIRLALKGVMEQLFVKGKGGSGGAANDLRELKAALVRTSDPALRRDLVKAIERVERKVVSRRVVEAQLSKADQIWHSNLTNAQKIEKLKDVQRAIGNRNVGATKRVQEKIDAARAAQVRAQNRTTAKVGSLKLSPKIVIPVTSRAVTIINGRSFTGNVNRQTILVRPGQAAIAS